MVPFFTRIATPSFCRRVVEHVPLKNVQRAKQISDAFDQTSRTILQRKKDALALGDEAVSKQVGEGKDIMGVLREYNSRMSSFAI